MPELGISGVLRGLVRQQAQAIDVHLVDDVRNLLFGAPGGPGRDLAALNIQRGRDHGLPDYNTARIAYGLPPAATFADVSSDTEVQDNLERAYGELRYIDLWAGGLAEDPLPGAMLGETFHTIVADQFRRLRDGDRYWFENDPYFLANSDLLAEIRTTTLARIIRRNTAIDGEIADNAFGGPPLPTIAIEAASGPIREGAPATFTLARTGATTWEFTVDVLVTETAAVLGEGPAFTASVTFAAGSAGATLVLPTDDDGVLEAGSAVSAVIGEARTHRIDAGGSAADIIVHDNDGIAVELHPAWAVLEWPGIDGVGIAAALQRGEVTEQVRAIYAWDEPTGDWLVYFPALEQLPDFNTLTTLRRGQTYWIALTEPVTWRVTGGAPPKPRVGTLTGP